MWIVALVAFLVFAFIDGMVYMLLVPPGERHEGEPWWHFPGGGLITWWRTRQRR